MPFFFFFFRESHCCFLIALCCVATFKKKFFHFPFLQNIQYNKNTYITTNRMNPPLPYLATYCWSWNLAGNKSLILDSLGELSVFSCPSRFLPISSCLSWPLPRSSHLLSAHGLWTSPFSGAGAIPSSGLSWNWSKNGTNNKAELWFTSKLRVENRK